MMQTHFSLSQLANASTAEAESILRNCVHCGFCTATCPTYVLEGNELDSPRGRIYMIKSMLEGGGPATAPVVRHIDRCLTCLSCMTTCPSSVNYGRLVDIARVHIEQSYKRPFIQRMIRQVLALVLPYPNRFRSALRLAKLGRPFASILQRIGPLKPMAAMLNLAPNTLPAAVDTPNSVLPKGEVTGRVVLMKGCAQSVLAPQINQAATALLTRLGIEVITSQNEGCCGALVEHMGQEEQAKASARANIDSWMKEQEHGQLNAILNTASGCGTSVKHYGHLLRDDAAYADKANQVSALAKDITEFLVTLTLPEPANEPVVTVAYHSACSMQHGQKITSLPAQLLENAGFKVAKPAEGHLCCGSAGVYNILQPEIANQLRQRKVRNIERLTPDVIAAGNLGCMTQIGAGTNIPIVHTVELLNWAYGGERPGAL